MNTWIIIWLIFWVSVMGLPNYLFKKYKVTYYQNSWQHTLFYIFSLIILFIVYERFFFIYFYNIPAYFLLFILCLLLFWFFLPVMYKDDYYTKKERFKYQLPKFFEIIFQQLCFLGGLLTFGVSPVLFSLIFFVVHIPMILLIPRKFAFPVVGFSFVGGLIFAYLQSFGINGFLISLSVHLLFYLIFHYFLIKKYFQGIIFIKR